MLQYGGVMRTIVLISDLHCGSLLGLCPDRGITLDGGGHYEPNQVQQKIWSYWQEFWSEWVPRETEDEPFVLVVNGDVIDGQPHGSKALITANMATQARIAREVLEPAVAMAAATYMTRGTEAHVGKSAEDEERLGRELGVVPDDDGHYTRDELWIELAGHLGHVTHHIATASSWMYESTAPWREVVLSLEAAVRTCQAPPQWIARGHRHREFTGRTYTHDGRVLVVVTPGWQAKTPYVYRTVARNEFPQFGGSIVRVSNKGELYAESYVRFIRRDKRSVVVV